MGFDDRTISVSNKLNCEGCGALLTYEPGTFKLKCAYCGIENEIITTTDQLVELQSVDYDEFTAAMDDIAESRFTMTTEVVHCDNCGANSRLDKNVTADVCVFCASPLVIDHRTERVVKPHGLIPFFVNQKNAYPLFSKWAGSLWFAPNDFKKIFKAQNNRLKGIYIPFWSYDADVSTEYEGERGEHYYVTKTRRTADGKTETYQEQRTRWYYASGDVYNEFRDVVVSASTSLPESLASKIGPWNMEHLKPFDDQYLSGFVAETFSINHVQGAAVAKNIMTQKIKQTIYRDIGGDDQRIHKMDSTYEEVKLKYVLLPVWLSAYKYKNKNYQILINAFNGKVYGQRPYSVWKIIFTVILVIVVIYLFSLMSQQ